MKTRLGALTLLFCLQPSFADPIPIPDQDDKSTCQVNGTVIELKTVSVSQNNPEYQKEADLMPGLKAKFAKRYIYYGRSTYVFHLVVGDDKVVAMAKTTVDDLYKGTIPTPYSTLILKSDVVIDNQSNTVTCNFILNGNKEQEQ